MPDDRDASDLKAEIAAGDVDGCTVVLADTEITPDEDLPEAT